MVRILLVFFATFFIYSCTHNDSLVIIKKRMDLIEQKINLNTERITENSKRLDRIEIQIEKIKKRLAEERKKDSFLSEIPPAKIIDNITDNVSEQKNKPVYQKNTRTMKVKSSKVHDINKMEANKLKINSNSIGVLNGSQAANPPKSLKPKELYKKALSLYNAGRYNESAQLFQEFLENFDKSNALYDNSMFWLAYSYIHMGNYNKAKKLLVKLIKEFPNNSLDKGGKTDAAIFTLIKIYKKEGETDKIRYYKGLLLERFPYSIYAGYIKRGLKG